MIPYWWTRRKNWDWSVELPRLVFASVLLAPYGAWIFDLTVLLVPVMAAAVKLPRAGRMVPVVAAVAAHILISLATILIPALYPVWVGSVHGLHDFIWLAPSILIWCVAVEFLVGRRLAH